MEEETAGSAKWTEEDIKRLLKTMKKSIANRAKDKIWSVGLKVLDWEIVAFGSFTAQECKDKWDEINQKLRKIKTLTELIVDAQSAMDSCPLLFDKTKIKLPKKPVAANAIYIAETMEKLKKKNPGLTSRDLMKLANDKYKKLPLQNKEKYVLQAEGELQQYKKHMDKLRRRHPDELEMLKSASHKKTNGAVNSQPKKKKKPPSICLNGYNLFCREQKSLMAGVPQKEITSVWSRRWKKLSKAEKDEYSKRCKELKTTQKKPDKKIFPGEPELKANSICGLYCKENLTRMDGKDPKQRFTEVCHQAKNISNEERERYQAQINNEHRIYQKELQEWFEKLSPREQVEYCQLNPAKTKYLQGQLPVSTQRTSKTKYLQRQLPVSTQRTSDSEDEDLDDSGSDYDLTIIQVDDENEEDVTHDVNMFDLY